MSALDEARDLKLARIAEIEALGAEVYELVQGKMQYNLGRILGLRCTDSNSTGERI